MRMAPIGWLAVLTLWSGLVPAAAEENGELARRAPETDDPLALIRGDIAELRHRVDTLHMPDEPAEPGVTLGGALRFNYGYRDWNETDSDKLGTAGFDTFRLNADGAINDVLISAEFRWYRYQQVLHHGWAGYQFTEHFQAQLGVSRVPFGVLPYASHSYWLGLPYYVGLEDDYDSGLKLLYSAGDFSVEGGFYKGEEWGASGTNQRYSYDVVQNPGAGQFNEESNQFNLQLRQRFAHGGGSTEIGLSGQYGQLYNTRTMDNGHHWAAAAHLTSFIGRWNLMLEAGRYEYHPENPPGVPDNVVRMGAYADDYDVAAEADFLVANLAYEIPVTAGPVTKLTLYENYSMLAKSEPGFDDSVMNVAGLLVTANPLYVHIDIISGENMPYQGPVSTERLLAAADVGPDGWHTRLNINVGYYF